MKFKDISDLKNILDALRRRSGKNISVESGIGLWKQFLMHDMFNELLLFCQPVIAGEGEKLFSGSESFTRIKLKSSRTFEQGVIKLHYERKGS